MAMKRLGAGEVYNWRNTDDVMLGVACDKKFREEHEQQASGALARMQARRDNALRFRRCWQYASAEKWQKQC